MKVIEGSSLRVWADGVKVYVRKYEKWQQEASVGAGAMLKLGYDALTTSEDIKELPTLEKALHISSLGGHQYIHLDLSEVPYEAMRDGKKEMLCLWVGIGDTPLSLEIHTRNGDISLLGDAKAPQDCRVSRLRLETLTGDIWVEGFSGKRLHCSTTKGETVLQSCDWERGDVQSLSGTVYMEHCKWKRGTLTCSRGGVELKDIQVEHFHVKTKAQSVQVDGFAGRDFSGDLGRGTLRARGLSVKHCELQSTTGDLQTEFVQDVQLTAKTLSGAITVLLGNGYRGFVAKVTGTEGTRRSGATKTEVKYGRYQKDYEGSCRIACNEKTSHLEIETGGELVRILSKKKRKEGGKET